MNLSILAGLRGVVPQVEHTGTPKLVQGVPTPKGYECNNNDYLSVTEHLEHPEHPKTVVTDKNSKNELLSDTAEPVLPTAHVKPGANMEVHHHPQPQGSKEARQQRRSKINAKCHLTAELDLGIGPTAPLASGTTTNYGPL